MPVRGRRQGEEWVEYASSKEAARQLGLNQGSISHACQDGWKPGGYEFEFAEPNEPPLLEGEEWKPWVHAKISNLGRHEDCYGVIKTPTPRADGYSAVTISGKKELIHVLVAKLFLPPPGPGQTQVNHKVGMGNKWWNLEWATRSENIRHSYATNPNRKSNAPKVSKKVKCGRVDGTEWRVFDSLTEAARVYGLSIGNVSHCCRANA
jgi:hypothetical protein